MLYAIGRTLTIINPIIFFDAIHDGTVIHDGEGNVDASTYIGKMPVIDKTIINGSNTTEKVEATMAHKKALAEWTDKKQQLETRQARQKLT